MGRDLKRADVLAGFCIFRLKEFDSKDWTLLNVSLGTGDPEPQTVIFIALQDLDSRNGFFMTLGRGNDVCLDSKPRIQLPPSGGGIGVYIALNL